MYIHNRNLHHKFYMLYLKKKDARTQMSCKTDTYSAKTNNTFPFLQLVKRSHAVNPDNIISIIHIYQLNLRCVLTACEIKQLPRCAILSLTIFVLSQKENTRRSKWLNEQHEWNNEYRRRFWWRIANIIIVCAFCWTTARIRWV